MRTIIALAIAALATFAVRGGAAGDPGRRRHGNARVDFFGVAAGASGPRRLAAHPAGAGGGRAGTNHPGSPRSSPSRCRVRARSTRGATSRGPRSSPRTDELGFAYSYDKEGDDLTAEYKAYADQHWSATR